MYLRNVVEYSETKMIFLLLAIFIFFPRPCNFFLKSTGRASQIIMSNDYVKIISIFLFKNNRKMILLIFFSLRSLIRELALLKMFVTNIKNK